MIERLQAMGPVAWVLGAMALAVVGCAVGVAVLRARGPWTALEHRLALALLGLSVAFPVVGFFGTVVMLLHAFRSLSAVDASHKQATLSAGIAGAMSCTAAGLLLLVPAGLVATLALLSDGRRAPKKRPGPASG